MKIKKKMLLMIAVLAVLGGFLGFSNRAFATEAPTLPVFAILLQNDEDAVAMTAFYVQDEEGSTYLVTSAYAGALIQEGYEAMLFSESSLMDVEYLTTENNISFINAKGVEASTPFKLSELSSASEGVMRFMTFSNEELQVSQKEIVFSDWEKSGDHYQSSDKLENVVYLGAPVLEKESDGVIGTVFMDQETHLILIDMRNMSFPEEGVIVAAAKASEAPEKEEETEPMTEEPKAVESSESSPGVPGWAAAVIVILGLLAFFANSSRKKKKEQKKEGQQKIEDRSWDNSAHYEGTINLNEEKTDIISQDNSQTPEIFPEWQVRGMSGCFLGQTFLISENLRFGRNPESHVAFPQNTKGVSGEHCELAIENGQVVLRDLNSTYGTYINHGTKLEPRVSYYLKEGDTFYLADSAQAFRLEKWGEDRQEYTPAVKAVSYPAQGQIYRADAKGRLLFGRAGHCQVLFGEASSEISANHCILYKDSTGMYLMDQGSTNGTFFSENQRLRPNVPYPVKKGMAFFLTSPEYTFVITED